MNRLSQILIFSMLVMGIIACHNSMLTSAENNHVMQLTKAPLKINTDCVDKSKRGFVACVEVYAPVCGCDGRTYGNDCHARREGVLSWEKGTCRQLLGKTEDNGEYVVQVDSSASSEIIVLGQNR